MKEQGMAGTVREDLVRDQFILELISGRFNELGAQREARRLGVYGEDMRYVVTLFLSEKEALATLMIDPAGLIRDALRGAGAIWAMALPGYAVACVAAWPGEEQARLDGLLMQVERLRELLERATGRAVAAAIGEPVRRLSELDAAYQSAMKSLELRRCLGGGQTLCYARDFSRIHVRVDYREALARIERAVAGRDGAEVAEAVRGVAAEASAGDPLPGDCRELFVQICGTLNRAVAKYCETDMDDLAYDGVYYECMDSVRDGGTLMEAVNALLERYLNRLPGCSSNRLLVEAALRYIQRNYNRRMTLAEISDHLSISPTYFCKLFRMETGENFTTYVSRCRIERAKELLADPRLKIYEIADRVGFSDVQYFNRVFRALTGVAPNAYRNGRAHLKQSDKKDK